MKQDLALSVIPAQAGIQSRENDFPLDCPVSLIPVYSSDPGRAMTEKGYPQGTYSINPENFSLFARFGAKNRSDLPEAKLTSGQCK
jgi:hypothetical protein